MSGAMMVGTCEVCGKKEVPLRKTTFTYDIKCECHSPEHFISIDHCMDCVAKEPRYTKVEFATEDLKNPIGIAMDILKDALKEDKSEGSYYYGWQSNIACTIMDNSDVSHEKANEIAIKFLNRLIGD